MNRLAWLGAPAASCPRTRTGASDLGCRYARPVGAPLRGHAGAAAGLAFSAGSRALASGGYGGTVRLCGAARFDLSHAEWRTYLPGQP